MSGPNPQRARGAKPLGRTDLKRLHRSWRRRTEGRLGLILDGVANPYNLGTIARHAAAYRVERAWLVGDASTLGPLGAFAVDIQAMLIKFDAAETHLSGFDLPDPIAMAVALDPSVATRTELLNVRVETGGEFAAGQTIVDHLGVEHLPPNVHVVLEASRERFLALIHETHRAT